MNKKKIIDNLAENLMNKFKEDNAKVDHTIDPKWIRFSFADSLPINEKDLVNDAAQKLVDEGLVIVTKRLGMDCLTLTQKGFESIYNNDEKEVIEKITKDILRKFKQSKCRIGEVLSHRWLELKYRLSLNPVEKDLYPKAIENLVNNEYINFQQNGSSYVLILQPKGYDYIYS